MNEQTDVLASDSTMSPAINELATALAKAQGAMENALKDTSNPFFKSKYADLASVWGAARKPLSDNGLSVIQTTNGDTDVVTVITTLFHSSGQWIRGTLRMRPVKNDPQGVGSCITYARRYALAAMVGVAPEEDDGEAATRRSGERPEPAKVVFVNDAELLVLVAMLDEAGISREEFCRLSKVSSVEEIPQSKFENAKAYLQKLITKKGKAA